MLLRIFKITSIAATLVAGSQIIAQSEEMPDYCADLDSDICKAYIHGFLDGAVITDTALINNILEGQKDRSDFIERAFATRVGQERFSNNPTYYADFCLPEGVPLTEDAARIASDLNQSHTGDDLAISVYGVIKQDFPCRD
jgi:hypothetical protein